MPPTEDHLDEVAEGLVDVLNVVAEVADLVDGFPFSLCRVDGCNGRRWGYGFCRPHFNRVRRAREAADG